MCCDTYDWESNPEEFIENNSFIDKDEIYTNGRKLMLISRVEQMLEHYYKERTCTVEGYDNGCEYDIDDNYHQADIPKFTLSCGHESYGNIVPNFCPECGARVI